MPDVDRFETKLRGRGWRRVYRLACSGAPIEAVVDKITGAVANVFRSEGTQCIRAIYSKLEKAFNLLKSSPLFAESISHNAFEELSSDIHQIVEDEGYTELSRFAEHAGIQTFNEMEQHAHALDSDVLGQHFVRNLVSALAQRRCLSAVRDGIMQSSGRDAPAQMNWEAALRELLLKPCGSLSESLLSKDTVGPIRAPRRLFRPKPTTLETLTQPMHVLGDSE